MTIIIIIIMIYQSHLLSTNSVTKHFDIGLEHNIWNCFWPLFLFLNSYSMSYPYWCCLLIMTLNHIIS